MKVCIFTETYCPVIGGGETQARLLAEGLLANGHSVIVLTRRSDESLLQHENYGGLSVYRLAPVGRGQGKKWGLLFSSLPALVRLRDQYDLIFVSGYRIIGLTAIMVGKLFRKPVILKADSQGEMSGEFFESGLRKFGVSRSSFPFRLFLGIRNFILKKADAFSAISPEIVSEWTSSGIPLNRIHLIPNSVDTTRFTPLESGGKRSLRKKLGLPLEAVIALYTGRLVSYKGLPLLLQVWNEIRYLNNNVLLILAGTGGLDIHNCENELHEYMTSTQMDRHVHFTGAVQNVQEYLQASDLFVFPTENDAFPSSILEAMACGLPIIATAVGAIQYIIKHKQNGILIEPGNRKQLLDGLNFLISGPPQIAQLGVAALKTVREQYSAECSNQKYLTLFQSIINHPRI